MELMPINSSYFSILRNQSEFLAEDDYIYDVPIGIVLLLSLLYGAISLLAVIGNSLVIWIVVTTRQMQTVTNWWVYSELKFDNGSGRKISASASISDERSNLIAVVPGT